MSRVSGLVSKCASISVAGNQQIIYSLAVTHPSGNNIKYVGLLATVRLLIWNASQFSISGNVFHSSALKKNINAHLEMDLASKYSCVKQWKLLVASA